jgi:hypothetical protein
VVITRPKMYAVGDGGAPVGNRGGRREQGGRDNKRAHASMVYADRRAAASDRAHLGVFTIHHWQRVAIRASPSLPRAHACARITFVGVQTLTKQKFTLEIYRQVIRTVPGSFLGKADRIVTVLNYATGCAVSAVVQ